MKLALLTFAIVALALIAGAPASAVHVAPLIVVQPDQITGQMKFKVNTGTNDPRVVKTCVVRIDQNGDPAVDLGCVDTSTGRAPVGDEILHNGEGVVVEIIVDVVMIANEDQLYSFRNYADVGGGLLVASELSENAGLLPQLTPPPIFLGP
jgi:hypothetical protein